MTDYPPDRIAAISQAFSALFELARYLRGEHGCPWDREQTLQSMDECLREETGELGDAIKQNDTEGISEEWGDVLFILLMLAIIGEEATDFKIEEAIQSIESKMIRRHPHVFGSSDVNAVPEVLAQWKRIKKTEKRQACDSLLDNLPQFYSALKRAQHIQERVAEVGFDWPDRAGVLDKLEEEVGELRQALSAGDIDETATELGDLLFSCVNLARFEGMEAETLLNKTIDKFVERFKYIETELERIGKSTSEASLSEMDALWEKAKSKGGNSQ